MIARLDGPWPVRVRQASSPKTQSHWRWFMFSTALWPLQSSSNRSADAVSGASEVTGQTVSGVQSAASRLSSGGGPENATKIMTLLIYKTTFPFLEMGRASAYSVVRLDRIQVVSLVQIWLLADRRG